MQPITRKEFLAKLDSYLEQKVKLKISGDIILEINFKTLDYELKEDIFTFKEQTNNNYISMNLNNINFMAIDNNKIICNLNDKADTIIQIFLI